MTYSVHVVPDSFQFLRGVPDGSVDVILTDPPYSKHVHENMSSGTAMKKFVDGGGGGGIPRVELPFSGLDSYGFCGDLVRIAKRWAVAFCAVEDFGLYRGVVGADQWVRGGIWYKPNSMGQLTGDRPAAAYEGLAIMHRKVKKRWNGRGSYALWSAESEEFPSEEAIFAMNGTRGEKERHPNQKPLLLCLELVAKFSNRGETVFDPFCGSGRIGEACVLLGRNYIGLDSDPKWVATSLERLAAVAPASITDEVCLRLCQMPRKAK